VIRRLLLRLLNRLARRHALHIERVDDMLSRAGRREK
jgi:hypothetical protein